MSSSTFNYTLEEQASLLSQFGHAMELVNERQRPASRVSLALQAVIRDDDIVVVPKVTATPAGKVYHVTGNARSAQEAINLLSGLLKLNLASNPAKIPLIIQPVDCYVRAVPLGKIVKTRELFGLFPRIVSPMTLFAFGAKFPEEQRLARHFTLWANVDNQFWYALLGVNGDQFTVDVSQRHLDGQWYDSDHILVYEYLPTAVV
ncbi:MAG: hypothetical protein Q7K35_03500 [bacterium]|nr:hypothetical protein [bacterium]